MNIYCCGCEQEVEARLANGGEIYPHRPDLTSLPFWRCDKCGNFVGCHHKTKDKTRPLGCIPTPELKKARRHIHKILDPLWQGVKRNTAKRKEIYGKISERLGYRYHTANIRNVEEAREIYRIVSEIAKQQES